MASQQQTIDILSTDHLHADLRGRSVRGGMLTLTSQGAQFLMQTVSTVVLARLLTPADFGLVAMVTAVSGLGQAFADLGLSEATIQRPEITHDQVSALFWINVGIGLTLTLIMMALAPFLSWFYHEPRLTAVTLVVSLTFIVGGLRVQHDALLRRQMRFASLAVRDVTGYVVAVPLAIFLAWRGIGYWAIVALPLTLNFMQMALSWLMVRWLPGLPRRGTSVRSLVSFGGHVAASYLVMNVYRSSDSVLIGWRWGAGPLGLYSRAFNLLMLPVRQLGAPARGVAVPAFSRVQHDPERLARFYLRTANLMMWITAPIFGLLFAAATPVIILTLGSRWRAAAPVFQILTIIALAQLLMDQTIWLFVSRGQSQRLLKATLGIAPIMIASYAIGLPFGIRGVALSGSIVFALVFPWVLKYSYEGTTLTLRRLFRVILLPVAVAVAGVCLAKCGMYLLRPEKIPAQLLVAAAAFVAVFLASLLVRPVREEIVSIRAMFAKHRRGAIPAEVATAEMAQPY